VERAYEVATGHVGQPPLEHDEAARETAPELRERLSAALSANRREAVGLNERLERLPRGRIGIDEQHGVAVRWHADAR
jgi:hypothetical protein